MNDSQGSALPISKIASGDAGLGTVTQEMVEERALELAKIDGRKEANEGDLLTAKSELLGPDNLDAVPELSDAELENLTEWDSPVEDNGQKAYTVRPEDDVMPSEILVEEGLEEADHSQRVSASEEMPLDEEEEDEEDEEGTEEDEADDEDAVEEEDDEASEDAEVADERDDAQA